MKIVLLYWWIFLCQDKAEDIIIDMYMYHLQVYEKAKGEEITAKMVMKELKKKYSDTDVTEVFGKDNDEYDILRIVSTIIEHQQNTVNVLYMYLACSISGGK